jgi:MFS family permease
MVGLGETYFAAFALAAGLGELVAGLVTTVPILCGACLQLVAPRGVPLVGGVRRWAALCAAVQGLSLLPLALAAAYGSISTPVLILFATVYWAAGLSTGPAWTTMIGGIIPSRIRTRFMAMRSRVCQAGILVGIVVTGLSLEQGRQSLVEHALLLVFAGSFTAAALARLFSAWMLARHSDPPTAGDAERVLHPIEMLRRMRHTPEGRLLRYMIVVQVCLQISGPYFTPYMLAQLDFNYTSYLLVISVAYTSKAAAFPLLGGLTKRFGSQPVLWVSGLLMIPLAWLWTLSGSVWFLVLIQVFSGVIWGAYELATLLMMFERIPAHERTSMLTFFNVANSAAMVGGSLVGAGVLLWMGETPAAYHFIFDLSTAVRVASVALLVSVVSPAARPGRQHVRLLFTRAIAVRPNVGTIERPLIESVDSEPDSDNAPKSC